MAATLLRTRLALAPQLCRSLGQATESGHSGGRRPRVPAFFVNTSKPDWSFTAMDLNHRDDSPNCTYLAMIVWGSGNPCPSSCHFYLNELLKDEGPSQIARQFFAAMIVRGTIPDASMFSLLVKSHCKLRRLRDVRDVVFLQMKAVGVAPDDSFFRILMYHVCARFGPDQGYVLLKKLRSTYPIQLPLSCYNPIVRRFCEKKLVEDVNASCVIVDLLTDMKQQGIFADEKIYKYLLKGRGHGEEAAEALLEPLGIGRQLFGQGIRIGAVFAANLVAKDLR